MTEGITHATALEHPELLPGVCGYRLLLMAVAQEETTKGGIILPTAVQNKEQKHVQVFRVVGVGAEAYQDSAKFTSPWCELGDYVLIGRYAGSIANTTFCDELRVVNDDEILATVSGPEHATMAK